MELLFFKRDNFNWIGEKPKSFHFKETLKDLPGKESLVDSDLLQLDFIRLNLYLDFYKGSNLFKRVGDEIHYKGREIVTALNHEDDELLLMSEKKEVLKIKVSTPEREVSEIFIGDEKEIAFDREKILIIERMMNRIGRGATISFIHTHNKVDILSVNREKTRLIVHGCSEADLKFLNWMREIFKTKIILSTLMPSGLKYIAI